MVMIMTFQELLDAIGDIQIEYEYKPVKNSPAHPVLYPDGSRSFLEDESCKSNVIGMDDGKFFGVYCYKAE